MSESEPFKCRTETRKRHSEQENVFESEQCKSGIYLLSEDVVGGCVCLVKTGLNSVVRLS